MERSFPAAGVCGNYAGAPRGAEGRGKRGGVRIIYYWAVAQEVILTLFVYPKNVQADLTRDQLKTLRTIVEEEYP